MYSADSGRLGRNAPARRVVVEIVGHDLAVCCRSGEEGEGSRPVCFVKLVYEVRMKLGINRVGVVSRVSTPGERTGIARETFMNFPLAMRRAW
jgi:hypothetical protein